MVGQRALRHADRSLELPERPLAEEQELEDDLPWHILPQDGEDSPLGLNERTGDEVPLAVSILFGFQDPIPFQVPEVVRKHASRHTETLTDLAVMHAGVASQNLVNPEGDH